MNKQTQTSHLQDGLRWLFISSFCNVALGLPLTGNVNLSWLEIRVLSKNAFSSSLRQTPFNSLPISQLPSPLMTVSKKSQNSFQSVLSPAFCLDVILELFSGSKCIAQEFPWWLSRERICLQCRTHRFHPWAGKSPWRRQWQPTLVFLPGGPHGQRSLAGYSPWGRKKSDTTEHCSALSTVYW